jgi:hypothetical protein
MVFCLLVAAMKWYLPCASSIGGLLASTGYFWLELRCFNRLQQLRIQLYLRTLSETCDYQIYNGVLRKANIIWVLSTVYVLLRLHGPLYQRSAFYSTFAGLMVWLWATCLESWRSVLLISTMESCAKWTSYDWGYCLCLASAASPSFNETKCYLQYLLKAWRYGSEQHV